MARRKAQDPKRSGSPQQTPLFPLWKPFRNESLFSNHFLEHRLPQMRVWAEDVEEVFSRTKALYEEIRDVAPRLNEAQLEDAFIRPLLREVLGWTLLPQGSTRIQGSRKLPDLVLFADEAHRQRYLHEESQSPEVSFQHALAVLEAKAWDVDLDVGRGDRAPHFQLVGYLSWLPVRFGFLTNGRLWRLYVKGENVGARTFYEVNLDEVVKDPDAFRYFFLFFRKDAFLEHAGRPAFIEHVRKESLNYARELEEDLRRVIYETWLERAGKAIHEATGAAPDEVFEATLLLLFRLLFIGYAEARQILPAREGHPYYPYSLHALVREITAPDYRPSSRGKMLFERLRTLFEIVNRGDSELNVPAYNGGLFADEPRNEDEAFGQARLLLQTLRLPDRETAELLSMLFTREGERGVEMVDFSTLDTRRLGSIYEGLTEYTFRIADEPMVWIRLSGGTEYVVARALAGKNVDVVREIPPGELYLVRHDGARKATGTYYTPDAFVSYLVREAVDAALQPRIENLKRRHAELEQLSEAQHLQESGRQKLEEALAYEMARELLSLRIVDPAMGSGHFLVEAVRVLSERLISVAETYPRTGLHLMIEELREEIGPHASDPRQVDDAALLRRLVVKRCIFGVDINPLAVELAKLSLWLETAVPGAPLSFLSHHFRVGNALVGYDLNEFMEEIQASKGPAGKSLSLFVHRLRERLTEITRRLERVQDLRDSSVDEVYRSAREFIAIQREAEPLRFLLDLATAGEYPGFPFQQFHPLRDPQLDLVNTVILEGVERAREKYPDVVEAVYRFRREIRPFHWWLEFPEAWKAGGFDVVIGNPPWDKVKFEDPMFFSRFDPNYRKYQKTQKAQVRRRVLQHPVYREEYERQKEEIEALGAYLRSHYRFYADRGDVNLYRVFMERSLQLLREDGVFAYVVPGAFYQEDGSAGLRRFLVEENRLEAVLGFENRGVFFPDVHSQFKIALVIARKGGQTTRPIRTFFLKHSAEALEDPKAVLNYDPDLLRRLSPDKLAFLELHSPMDVQIVRKCYDQYPPLASEEHPWKIDFTNDLHMTNDRDLFHEDGGDLPLYEGKMIWQFRHDWALPRYWLRLDELMELKSRDGTPKFQLPDGSWRWEHYRVAFRGIARNTDVRTLIASIVPMSIAGHSLWIEQPGEIEVSQKVFVAGYLNSHLADYLVRFRSVMNVQKGMLERCPFPSLREGDQRMERVASLSARLIGYSSEFTDLMNSLGLD